MPPREWTCRLSDLSDLLNTPVTGADLEAAFARLGGMVAVAETGGAALRVTWRPALGSRPPEDAVLGWLRAGEYAAAMLVMEVLLDAEPDNTDLLYNLGMAHSDRGHLPRAIALLEHLADLSPQFANGLVALGVAEVRQGRTDQAVTHLRQALQHDDANPWAHRNLGAALLRQGEVSAALTHLRRATELAPDDPQGWFGLAKAAEDDGDLETADDAYLKVIELAGFDRMADAAREARSRLAHKTFKERTGSPQGERMDAVMYCLDALERFDDMGEAIMGQVVTEIALLGSSGLDVNDPERKYQLRNLEGRFSGLQLVSLMYVGMKRLQPAADVGFDLSREYDMARALHGAAK